MTSEKEDEKSKETRSGENEEPEQAKIRKVRHPPDPRDWRAVVRLREGGRVLSITYPVPEGSQEPHQSEEAARERYILWGRAHPGRSLQVAVPPGLRLKLIARGVRPNRVGRRRKESKRRALERWRAKNRDHYREYQRQLMANRRVRAISAARSRSQGGSHEEDEIL
jgi:hypothetical protein